MLGSGGKGHHFPTVTGLGTPSNFARELSEGQDRTKECVSVT